MNLGSYSVVIPCYEPNEGLIDAVDSIINQTIKPVKIFIVDDCSKNSTVHKVIDSSIFYNSPLIEILVNSSNKGPGFSRHRGIKLVDSDFVAFLDSDDVWDAVKMQLQLKFLTQNKINAIGCYVNGENRFNYKQNIVKKIGFISQVFKHHVQPSTLVCNTDVIKDIGGFDESYRYAEEGRLMFKLAMQKKLWILTTPLVKYAGGSSLNKSQGLSAHRWPMNVGNIYAVKSLIRDKDISVILGLSCVLWILTKYIYREIKVRFLHS